MKKEKIIVVSTFDGCSGGMESLNRANINVGDYFASEIKEDGIRVAMDNHPEIIQIGDVTKCSYKDGILYTENGDYNIPKVHLFIGGSPCQDFSQANKERKGLDGDKSGLFFEWLRLRNEIDADYFLLENVKMKPEHQEAVNNYVGCKPNRINSKLVSAQLRDRFYWTNINNGHIPQPKDRGILLSDILTDGYSEREKSRCLLEGDSRPLATKVKMFHRHHKFHTIVFKNKSHYENCREHYDKNFKKEDEYGKLKNMSAKEIESKIKEFDVDVSVYDEIRYLNQTELERLQTVAEGYTRVLDRNQSAGVLGDGWNIETLAHIWSYLPDEYKI